MSAEAAAARVQHFTKDRATTIRGMNGRTWHLMELKVSRTSLPDGYVMVVQVEETWQSADHLTETKTWTWDGEVPGWRCRACELCEGFIHEAWVKTEEVAPSAATVHAPAVSGGSGGTPWTS